MKKTAIQKYAALIARKGVNVQKGQDVIINASVEQPEFVRMVVDECYKAGARRVKVEWSYQPITKSTYRYAKAAALAKVEDWEKAKLEHMAETLPAMIHIISDDPDGLKGINQKKVSEVGQKRYPIMKPIQDKMANKYQWCIAAVPGKKWAKKIFPELRASTAMEKLWESILYTSRADGDDPVEAWRKMRLHQLPRRNRTQIPLLKRYRLQGRTYPRSYVPRRLRKHNRRRRVQPQHSLRRSVHLSYARQG